MKKTMKILGKVAAAFLVIGIIMIIVGISMGGVNSVLSDISLDRLSIGIDFNLTDKDFKEMTSIKERNTFNDEEVNSIEFEADYGEFKIVTWDKDYYEIQNVGETDNNQIRYSLEDGFLRIAVRGNKFLFFGYSNLEVVIHVPRTAEIADFKINLGAGELTCNNIVGIGKLDFNIGAGQGKISNVYADSFTLDVGAGECNIEDSKFGMADFRVGVGEVDVDADIEGNVVIDCGVGEIDVKLADSYNDYNYKIDVGIGEVSIDGETYSNDESTVTTDKNNSMIDIDCGIGEVSVDFYK